MSKKRIAIGTSLILSICILSAAPSVTSVSDGMKDFSVQLFDVIPNVAMQQGVWPDAWIGKLVPSVPPHFGGGITLGMARLPMDGINRAISQLNSVSDGALPTLKDNLVFPTLTADIRIGGIFLPFDIGMSFMRIPNLNLSKLGADITVDFFTIGGSLRVPVLQEKLIILAVSFGAGFMYSKGFVEVREADNAYLRSDYKTKTIFLEAQVSKKILFLVPFVGFRGVVSDSINSWKWQFNAAFNGYTVGQTQSGTETRSLPDAFGESFQPQVFGGVGFDIFLVQTTISASYDFRNKIWGTNLSLRFKM